MSQYLSDKMQVERLIIENLDENGKFDMKGIAVDVVALLEAARHSGVETGIKRATGGYSYTMPMKSVRTRNTAFKLYAVKFFNSKIKERRTALLLQLKNEQQSRGGDEVKDKE